MRKLVFITVIIVLLGIATACVAEQAAVPLPVLTIPRTESAPVIDGKLDDSLWGRAAKIPYFILVSSTKSPTQATEARVFYTNSALYVGFRCREAKMEKVKGFVADRDERVWSDDCVEVFIKVNPAGPYFHFAANILGTKFDAVNNQVANPEVDYNPDWRVVTSREKDGWEAELEIPFAELGLDLVKPGDTWLVNFCREEKPVSENSTWSVLKARFNEPDRFGTLVFGDENVPLIHIRNFLASANGVIERAGEMRNPGNETVEADLNTYVLLDGKKRSFARRIPVEARGMQKFRLADEISDEGRLNAVLEVTVGGRMLYRAVRPFYIPPVRLRFSELASRLKALEVRIGEMPEDLGSTFAGTLQTLEQMRESAAKGVLWIPESGPEHMYSLMRALDDFERGICAAEVRLAMPESQGSASVFYAWAANPWVQLRPGDLPPHGVDLAAFETHAYQGEKVYAAVNVTSFGDETLDFRVSAGPFSSDGNTVPASDVEIHTCAFVKEEAESDSVVGDALPLADQANRLIVPPYQTGQVFLIIKTKGLPAGDYSGPVTVRPTTGGASQNVTVRFKIHPLELPDEPRPRLCTWGSILNISWAKPDPLAYLRDAVEHGINVFLISPYSVAPKLDKEGNILEPIDYSKHDERVAAYRPYGMVAGIYSVGIVYDGWARKAGIEYMSPAYKKGFIAWFRDWVGHLKSLGLGYEDFAFELVDEPGSKESFRLHMDIGRLVREADPNARVILTANFNGVQQLKEIAEVTDIWVPHGRVLEDDLARQVMKDSGKEMWVYVCSGDSKRLDPINYYRFLAWQAFRYDLSGWGFFAHMWWGELPWESDNTTRKHLATYSTVYPGANGPVTSRRWEVYWKGHEDFRALHLLKRLLAEGERAGLAADALAQAGSALQEARNATVVLQEMKEKDVDVAARADYLDGLRLKVAEASVKLAGLLGRLNGG